MVGGVPKQIEECRAIRDEDLVRKDDEDQDRPHSELIEDGDGIIAESDAAARPAAESVPKSAAGRERPEACDALLDPLRVAI